MQRLVVPFVIVSAFVLSTFLVACGPTGGEGEGEGEGEEPATFTRVKEEVFELSCSTGSCHDDSNPAGGLDLKSDGLHGRLVGQDSTVTNPATSAVYKYVVAGDADASLLYQILQGDPDDGGDSFRMPALNDTMPSQNPLDDVSQQLIQDWINGGAEDN